MHRKLAGTALAALAAAAVATVPAHAGASKNVSVSNNAFSAKTVNLKKGDKVVWKWTKGGVPHNVTPANGNAGSATSSKKGFTFTKSFSKAGTFKYVCTIHKASMQITVKVS
jgi:plastocyanin